MMARALDLMRHFLSFSGMHVDGPSRFPLILALYPVISRFDMYMISANTSYYSNNSNLATSGRQWPTCMLLSMLDQARLVRLRECLQAKSEKGTKTMRVPNLGG